MTEQTKEHLPEIDRLKGFAILSVVCIHAKFLEGTLFFEHVVNRAVPIFLVLFGITSELWWERTSGGDAWRHAISWWSGRFKRLMIPLWAMAALWWLAVLRLGYAPMALGLRDVFLTFSGYAPWIGTSWFVTLILELVLVFPALRWLVARLGPVVSLPIAAAICVACVWYVWDVVALGRWLLGNKVAPPGWYYSWIFAPRVFWHVVAGIFVARLWSGRPGKVATAAAAALSALGVLAVALVSGRPDEAFIGPLRQQVVIYLFDVPLVIALLGVFRFLPLPGLGRLLTWCGVASWGLYLGHLLVHELIHLRGIAPETGPPVVRGVYATFLLATAAVLTWFGASVRRVTGRALSRATSS